jgi:hypothetical protein
MIEIVRISVNLYVRQGESLPFLVTPGAEWLRNVISQILGFKENGLDMTAFNRYVFFNEDPKTQKGKNSYPLVLFQHVGNEFTLTGFDDGAKMLAKIFKAPQELFYFNKNIVVRFIAKPAVQFEIKASETVQTYRLLDWIPFKMTEYKEKMEGCRGIKEQLTHLEERIRLQIMKDFANHFSLNIEEPEIRILDINTRKGAPVFYEEHEFRSFSPVFETKLSLPDDIGLGHGKAFGFGILRNTESITEKTEHHVGKPNKKH